MTEVVVWVLERNQEGLDQPDLEWLLDITFLRKAVAEARSQQRQPQVGPDLRDELLGERLFVHATHSDGHQHVPEVLRVLQVPQTFLELEQPFQHDVLELGRDVVGGQPPSLHRPPSRGTEARAVDERLRYTLP